MLANFLNQDYYQEEKLIIEIKRNEIIVEIKRNDRLTSISLTLSIITDSCYF